MTKTEFKQRFGEAARASLRSPVFITNHGKDCNVLLAIEDYEELIAIKEKSLVASEVLPTPRQQKD